MLVRHDHVQQAIHPDGEQDDAQANAPANQHRRMLAQQVLRCGRFAAITRLDDAERVPTHAPASTGGRQPCGRPNLTP